MPILHDEQNIFVGEHPEKVVILKLQVTELDKQVGESANLIGESANLIGELLILIAELGCWVEKERWKCRELQVSAWRVTATAPANQPFVSYPAEKQQFEFTNWTFKNVIFSYIYVFLPETYRSKFHTVSFSYDFEQKTNEQ